MACQGQTVLLVERGASQDGCCEARLREAGFNVLTRTNPSTASPAHESRRADLVVLNASDNASEVVAKLRAIAASPETAGRPIILITNGLNADGVDAALQAGASDYLDARFQPEEFRVRAELAMRRRRKPGPQVGADSDVQQRLEAMTLLNRFYEDILKDGGVEATCRTSVETAAKLMSSDRVSMLLADAKAHSLKFAHAVGMPKSVWHDRQVPLSSPVAGRAIAARREIVVNRSTAWPRQPRYRAAQFVSMPLIGGGPEGDGTVLGVLNVTERRDGRDYEPKDVLALRQLARAAAFAIDAVRTRRKLDETRDSIIFSLARLSEYRHASTGKHLERVRELSLVLARYLARDPRVPEPIDSRFLADLGRAAPLHDVGKVAIPDRILLKAGRLTPEELAIIRGHTAIGAATLQSVMSAGHDDSFLKMAMEIAHCHHERYDGRGYPRGLAGEGIPLSARIVCVADSYDAIRMKREYKPARPHAEAARELLLGSGTQFDPIVVQAFCALEDQFESIYNTLMEGRSKLPPASDALIPLAARA